MIPLFVSLRGRRVVIFGGGTVAARKAAFFSGEADVEVFSRSHGRPVRDLPVCCSTLDLSKTTDAGLRAIIKDAFLVVAALPDRQENNRIGRLCSEAGVLFNNADGAPGDLIIPSVSEGKFFTIAMTTHGRSPAVSRFVREHIDERSAELDSMILLQDALRSDLKATVPSQKDRQEILRQVIKDPEVWEALSRSCAEGEVIARRKHLP